MSNTPYAVQWQHAQLHLLDQRKLPQEKVTLVYNQATEVAQAIKDMVVRGAPAIGIAAAYGVVLAAKNAYQTHIDNWRDVIQNDLQQLAQARPTAVNLVWALQRMQAHFAQITGDPVPILLQEAQKIQQEDITANYTMGQLGSELLSKTCRVLTHCNAGALATGGYGTALGVIRYAWSVGKITQVYADETRPWLQGSRLTAWELLEDNIPVTLIVEGAAATLMREKRIDWVIVGADRITANGDVANKIGTYSLAVLARQHGVKMMVVAPISTIDMELTEGNQIIIEERDPQEIMNFAGKIIAPQQVTAWNPAFDVTPAELIDAIVTEKGVVIQPSIDKMRAIMYSN